MSKNNPLKRLTKLAFFATILGVVSAKALKSDGTKLNKQSGEMSDKIKLLFNELDELIVNSDGNSLASIKHNNTHKKRYQEAITLAETCKDKLSKYLSETEDTLRNDKELKMAIKDSERAISHIKNFLLK